MSIRRREPGPEKDAKPRRGIALPAAVRLLPTRLVDIPCIGPLHAARLARVNIATTEDLLRLGALRAQRRALGAVTGLREASLLAWVRIADLMRLGMDAGVAERLIDFGLTGSARIAAADRTQVAATMTEAGATREQADAWGDAARAMAIDVE